MEGSLLFVGGDLSGIQKFIYNITSKRAMVSLKGRSHYLKGFTEKVCDEILNIPEIKNSEFSQAEMKIYCSGGKFYLQVPDTENIRNAITEIRKKQEKELWNEHQGQLSINIDYVPFCYVGNEVKVGAETGNIGILWKNMTEKFNALKNQKFKSLLLNDYDIFFNEANNKVGGNVKVCQITGIEGAVESKFTFKDSDGDKVETLTVLPSVKEQIELGKKLRDRQGFKMLEEYAGDTYLGVLRMDVDNLGAKFIRSDFAKMEDYTTFSKALDRFFDAEKGNLHDIQEKHKEYLNIVYAGGDDIFVVGRWDKVIDFAEDVQGAFTEYCQNELKDETLSISGGIAIVNKKFPIAKAAEMAGEAEDAAKKCRKEKRAFNMLGESVAWDGEKGFKHVKSYKAQFVDHIQKDGLSRAVLHKIMNYAAVAKENLVIEEENKAGYYKRKPNWSYLWHTAYYLTRFMGKEKENEPVYEFCKDLRDIQLHTPEDYRLMSLAARWAELELREITDNINDKNE